jgi:aryl-alcohol dehydrogenase-like predicted oxidoreductase
MFDSHAHYDDKKFDGDRESLLRSLAFRGISGVVNAGCCVRSSYASLALAEKNKITPAQLLIAWHINRGVVVIPKSTKEERLKANFSAQYVALGQDDMNKIKSLGEQKYRFVNGEKFARGDYTTETIFG